MAKESLSKQQKHDLLAQYARMLLKTKVHIRPCPKSKNLDNSWINNVCNIFHEPVKLITNHDTPVLCAQMGGNGGPRGGNDGNSGNGGVFVSTERYGGKNYKYETTGQASGSGGRNQYGPQGGGSGRKLQHY